MVPTRTPQTTAAAFELATVVYVRRAGILTHPPAAGWWDRLTAFARSFSVANAAAPSLSRAQQTSAAPAADSGHAPLPPVCRDVN